MHVVVRTTPVREWISVETMSLIPLMSAASSTGDHVVGPGNPVHVLDHLPLL